MKLNFFSSAFEKTLRHFGITGKALSIEARVSQNHISDFRNGGNISAEALSALMQAMEKLEPGSTSYFLKLVGEAAIPQQSKPISLKNGFEALVECATDDEIEEIMLAIARKWRLRNSKELCA
ncbi:hypothetical protein AMR41_27945 [Hapalosiphon sp. MRB220]|nr:hypothetical protein AMR41_27945 [Hapalosiphon sp. MRB220]